MNTLIYFVPDLQTWYQIGRLFYQIGRHDTRFVYFVLDWKTWYRIGRLGTRLVGLVPDWQVLYQIAELGSNSFSLPHLFPQEKFLPDKRTVLRGKKTSRARFGLAVSAIGDINNDGFNGENFVKSGDDSFTKFENQSSSKWVVTILADKKEDEK